MEHSTRVTVVTNIDALVVERERKRGDTGSLLETSLFHCTLNAQTTISLAAAAYTHFVNVAVVVDGRREKTCDNHAAEPEHHNQQQHGLPPAFLLCSCRLGSIPRR